MKILYAIGEYAVLYVVNSTGTVINDLKNGKLNCFEKKYTKKYILYRENYEEKANERALKRKIKFFSVILKRNKEKHKFNKDACVEQTMKDFD